MLMGGVYLLYSAYFLSMDFSTILTIMSIVLSLLYLGLAYTFTMDNLRNRKKIRVHMEMVDPDQENIMRESFILKSFMIKWITLCTLGFCVSSFITFGLINMLDDVFARSRANLVI